MDGYKRPFRGSKIYVRKEGEEDDTLVNLYKESEYAQENAAADIGEGDALKPPKSPNTKNFVDDDEEEVVAPKSKKAKAEPTSDDTGSEDIDDFINETDNVDEELVPMKRSAKKARQKQRKREKRERTAKSIIAKIFVCAIIIALVVFGGLWFFKPSFVENTLDSLKLEDAVADEIYYSPLTGLETKNKNISTAEATCIMVENSVDARPQSGLNAAGVVYEGVAEGGITRFMAIYQGELPAWVGPIRSARQTFVHLARPYNCGYVHVGGATNAINTLKTSGYRDLDGGWVEGQYVFRTTDRWAPHNVYTDAAHLKEWSNNKGYRESKFTGFKRVKPDTSVEVEEYTAKTITVVMSGDDSYNARWTYNPQTGKYYRAHVYGGNHNERTKNNQQTQITTDVVIAMKTSTVARSSEPKYYDHVTTGSGEAYVFQNGIVQKATWRRADVKDELKFFDGDNNEIELNRGRTWVSVYSNVAGGRVSWK